MNFDLKNVSNGTIIRTVTLAVALINQCLACFGKEKLPFTEDELYQALSATFTLITSIVAWWKNNSFTEPAINADKQMHEDKLKG